MFEELKKKLKDRYYLFLAKKYINNMKKKDSLEGLSLDVLSEEIKHKILEEGLTDDKEFIYSLIMNLTSEELRKEMIAKYISTEEYPDIKIIKELPTSLKIEILKNKILRYRPSEIKEILDGLDDREFIRFLESNKSMLYKYLENEEFIGKLNDVFTKPDNFLETVLYSRFQKIEDKEIKELFEEIISVKTLTDRIDDKILGVVGDEYDKERYITSNMDRLTSEEKKVEYLLKQSSDSKTFKLIYKTLSEESRRKVLSAIFTKEKIKKYVAEKAQSKMVKDFGTYLEEYCKFAEMDIETIKDLYYIARENSSARIIIYNMVEDEEKAKLVLDDKYYSKLSNEVMDLMFAIQDEELLLETIHKYAAKFGNNKTRYEYLNSKIDDDLRVKLVQYEINKKENVDKNLLLMTLPEINDKDALKQILIQNLNQKYFRLDKEKDVNTINSIVADKIIEHNLADELLSETDISNFSEENKFLLLLNASKETREKILEKNKELVDIVNAINENEDVLKKLSDGTSNSLGRLTFYRRLIAEIDNQTKEKKSFTVSQKLKILEKFQEKHVSIAETALFEFFEENILKEFGGLEKVENLVRYPDTQVRILRMDKEHLKVVRHVNEYTSENLPNADYILNEILTEYSGGLEYFDGKKYSIADCSKIYSVIAEYISTHDNIPKDVNDKIFNIITNNRIYTLMFHKLGREITVEDIENINQIKGEFCDKVIRGEISESIWSVKNAYLMKYYNLDIQEAQSKLAEYTTFIEELDDSPENLPLKKYIFSLHNILVSNPEILSIAYDLSKDAEPIDRIEIEKIEYAIKEKIAKELKRSLFKTDKEKIGTTGVVLEDGKEAKVDVYEAKDDFNMLVTVLDAYGGGNGVYENYEEQWNTNKYAQNQRICTTYIGNNSLKTVKRDNCVIYGFTEFEDSALVKMAPYDIVSKNDQLVTTSARDAICIGPKKLINTTRRYNEIDIERTRKDGKKIQPSYIVCFAKSIDEVNEESKKAAAQFGIPIVLIDREKCAEREVKKIDEVLKRFTEEKDISLIDNIVEEFCNNKYTSDTTERDAKEAKEQGKEEIVHIDKKYFSDERFVEILQTMIDVAKTEEAIGNTKKSKEILLAIKTAMKKENDKHILWQKKFGARITYSPLYEDIFSDIWKQVSLSDEERILQDEINAKEKIVFLTQIDGNKNNVELGKRTEDFREDSYSMNDVQQKILDLTDQDLEMISDYTYKNLTIQNMYTLLVGRDCGLDDAQIKLIIESFKIEQNQKEVEGHTEEENEILRNLNDIKYYHCSDLKCIIDLLENPIENRMIRNENITNEIFEACVNRGVFDEEISLETLSLEEKIVMLKNATPYEVFKVVDSLRIMSVYDEVKQKKLRDLESYFAVNMGTKENTFNYIEKLPKEKQEKFILMAKVLLDARILKILVEKQERMWKTRNAFR